MDFKLLMCVLSRRAESMYLIKWEGLAESIKSPSKQIAVRNVSLAGVSSVSFRNLFRMTSSTHGNLLVHAEHSCALNDVFSWGWNRSTKPFAALLYAVVLMRWHPRIGTNFLKNTGFKLWTSIGGDCLGTAVHGDPFLHKCVYDGLNEAVGQSDCFRHSGKTIDYGKEVNETSRWGLGTYQIYMDVCETDVWEINCS